MNYLKLNSLRSFLYASSLAIVAFSMLVLSSCSKDDKDPTPANEIRDDEGLTIELEWSTGGSVSQSQEDQDLDLFLYKGTTLVDGSASVSSFEEVGLSGLLSDGDYKVSMEVFDEHAANWTVYIKGTKSNTTKTYTGSVSTSDYGATIEVLTLNKSGNKYTITQ